MVASKFNFRQMSSPNEGAKIKYFRITEKYVLTVWDGYIVKGKML